MLENVLRYDPENGKLYWLIDFPNDIKAGDEAGSYNRGYKQIWYDGKTYRAHRVAWYLYYGKWPERNIDHINGIKSDNRISNLRDVSQRENKINSKRQHNNTSGKTGVIWNPINKRWRSSIIVDGKKISLGSFVSFDEAVSARTLAEQKYYGEHCGRE